MNAPLPHCSRLIVSSTNLRHQSSMDSAATTF